MVGRPDYLDQLSRPVVFRGAGELLLPDDAAGKEPAGFREMMEKYRRDLVEKNKEGMSPMDAGPVTLGIAFAVVAISRGV